jgi:hypothetical protein
MRGLLAVLLMWVIITLVVLGCIYQPVLVLICCVIGLIILFSWAGHEKWK